MLKGATMNKFEKITLLASYGLNTTEMFLLKKNEENKWNDALEFINKHNGASIRTFADDEAILTPHKPNLDLSEATNQAKELMNKYNVILTERINPNFALCAGKVSVVKEGIRPNFSYELSMGSGSVVRDVDKRPRSELFCFSVSTLQDIVNLRNILGEKRFVMSGGNDVFSFIDEEVEKLVDGLKFAQAEMVTTKFYNHIFEMSVYSIEIGKKQLPVIFWECYSKDSLSKV